MSLNFSTIRDVVHNLGGVIQPASGTEENLILGTGETPVTGKASGKGFIDVAPPQFGLNVGSFGAVLSRTFLIGEVGGNGRLVPLHYTNIAVTILLREGGTLRKAFTPQLEHYLLVPMDRMPNPDAVKKLKEHGIPFIDTECPSDAFDEMRRSALAATKKASVKLFSMQIQAWRERYGGEGQVLAIAGTFTDVLPDARGSDVVAISDASSVLASKPEGFVGALPLGNMTHPFSADDGRHYFYLRLRDSTLKDPGFGLIRIEFMPTEGVNDIDYAKALAHYILRERIPINPSWQGNSNQIYPLSACLNYMLDFTVTPQTVNAYFGRRD
jgi:hypothetical protein